MKGKCDGGGQAHAAREFRDLTHQTQNKQMTMLATHLAPIPPFYTESKAKTWTSRFKSSQISIEHVNLIGHPAER